MKRAIISILAAWGMVAAVPQAPRHVPCDVQFDLMVKILTFDRNLKARVGDELVFGIIYQEEYPASLQVKTEMERVVTSTSIKKTGHVPIRPVVIDLNRKSRWDEELIKAGVDIAYLAPLRDAFLVRIIALCRELKITTVGSLPEYPSLGATIGFESVDNRSHILINLQAAKAEGVDFNSRLLGLAKVFR